MNASAASVRLKKHTGGFGDMPANRSQCVAAGLICAGLGVSALAAAFIGTIPGPQNSLIVPISATTWSLADLLTGFLLIAQFSAGGRVVFAVLAAAYTLSGLLTWPFVLCFPGTGLLHARTLGDESLFAYFWMTWHASFPVLVAIAMACDEGRMRLLSRSRLRLATVVTAVVPVFAVGAVTAFLFATRNVLPHLVIGGHLQPVDRLAFHPVIIGLNLFGCALVIARNKPLSILRLWLCAAMFSEALDSLLVDTGAKIYSIAWDVGKGITVITAATVLVMILSEVVRMYALQLRLNERLEGDLAARARIEAALRVSDERFRQVEEHAPIGLALVTLDGRFMRVNPALCALTGRRMEELLALDVRAIVHPDDVAADRACVARVLAEPLADCEVEMRFVHADARVVWVSSHCSLVRDDAGGPSYFIRQVQDIGARKTAQREIETAQRVTLAATESKAQFVATMSHEIRTPLNGIIGMVELLSLSRLSADQSEYVNVVRDSGHALLRIVNDILDHSKVEAGKLELAAYDFDLSAQIRSAVSLLRPQFVAKGVAFVTAIGADAPATVNGDAGRVRQILVNLLGNALKFTPPLGRVRLEVETDEATETRLSVLFTVVDTGPGIPQAEIARIFEPFSQLDLSTTRRHGGTGLGLSISKFLVDLMGGSVGVRTELGVGSSFWFRIPFAPASESARVLDAPAREMGERRAAVVARREKILLAEDNAINVLLATKQFKRLGFDITVASDGREALEAVRRERFDIVFMDCHMPHVDGFEATRAIRSLGSAAGLRIVAMTANAQSEDRAACLAAGMDDYVSKPVSLADLQSTLERWLPSAPGSSLHSGGSRA